MSQEQRNNPSIFYLLNLSGRGDMEREIQSINKNYNFETKIRNSSQNFSKLI